MMKMKIEDIKLNETNPRDITPDQFAKLKLSLTDFPEMLETRPLIIDEDNVVLGGNMRLRVLKDLGYKEVPVKQVTGWTEEQKKEFVIKDNLSFGEWDWEILANNWDAADLQEWGLEVPIEFNEADDEPKALEDDFEIPEEIETDIIEGDVIEFVSDGIVRHRMMCGDSTNSSHIAKLMESAKADLVFTDPPYGVDYKSKKLGGIKNDTLKDEELHDFIRDSFELAIEYSNPKTAFYCWYEDKFRDTIQRALENAGLQYKSNLIWNKGMNLSGADYQKAHENCLYFQKEGERANWYGERDKKTILGLRRREILEMPKAKLLQMILNMQDQSTVWDFDRDSVINYSHPTQKPVTLSGRAILNNTLDDQIVLDMFLGSGSTMVACHQINRNCFGMELDPKYCQVIVDRMKSLDYNIIVKKNGKEI